MPRSHKNNGVHCQHSTSCFLRELPHIGDPFLRALAVCTMVVQPWHIAAGTNAELHQNLPDLEARFLH
jgi:hypothetical protein